MTTDGISEAEWRVGQTHKQTETPDKVMEAMADAMLDPVLRPKGFGTKPPDNVVRKQVLARALRAAEALGWRLCKTS